MSRFASDAAIPAALEQGLLFTPSSPHRLTTEMQDYVDACARRSGAEQLPGVLDRIIARGDLHARFVNTLSRLEYVGVRNPEEPPRRAP